MLPCDSAFAEACGPVWSRILPMVMLAPLWMCRFSGIWPYPDHVDLTQRAGWGRAVSLHLFPTTGENGCYARGIIFCPETGSGRGGWKGPRPAAPGSPYWGKYEKSTSRKPQLELLIWRKAPAQGGETIPTGAQPCFQCPNLEVGVASCVLFTNTKVRN